ncbi:patatin-like phospholipase family protein [Leptolyngbya sp. AN02str]|uniref:patatin-like phospholipase family protein n=1 Tax=Leptolyngbya sp. AN02str TaxID=3423363 RepID=UPI003D31C8E6
MAIWNPAEVRDRNGLMLTLEEKAHILANLPTAPDGHRYADAVFEGGGVKGTAFLGALRCFSEVGLRWRKVAGTSAGAITAALVAADLTIEELESVIGQLDYEDELLAKKTSRFVFSGSPEKSLQRPLWLLANLWFTRQQGQYSTEPFKAWLQKALGDRLNTFNDLRWNIPADQEDTHWHEKRALKVVISDISRGEMLVLPDDLDSDINQNLLKRLNLADKCDFSVPEAVRLSMSIPFFFAPGKLGDYTIVDGGILSNFPLWIYDAPPGGNPPRCPTFGFRLSEARPETHNNSIDNAVALFSGMLQTMMNASDRYHLRENGQGRVVNIDTTGITATQFNLGSAEKDRLYCNGYLATKQFLLEQWNWSHHLHSRGYTQVPSNAVSANL